MGSASIPGDLDKPKRKLPAIATEIRSEVEAAEALLATETMRILARDSEEWDKIDARFEAKKPKREEFDRIVAEEFSDQDRTVREAIAEIRYQQAGLDHHTEKQTAFFRLVLASADEWIAEDPVTGPLFVAKAAAGIEFNAAHRACQRSAEGEFEKNVAEAKKRWMTYRHARDACYLANGEPPMDERELEFNDFIYNPAFASRR